MTRRGVFAVALALCPALGCAPAKPVVRSAVDVAHELCSLVEAERRGINPADAARLFCATEAQLEPWFTELLEAERRATARTAQAAEGGAR